jgi:hypothetical protein
MREHAKANPKADAESLATSFVAGHTKAELTPLFVDEFIRLRRTTTAAIEAAALAEAPASGGGGTSSSPTATQTRSKLGTLATLLDEPYRISDGVERKAKDMTIREWETRRRLLEGQQEGITRSIEVCDRAIAAIKSAGVNTLGEV